MVKKSKSVIACLLAVLMILTATPLAFAEENDPLEYTIFNETYYKVSRCDENASGEVVVPAEHDGKPVKEVGGFAFQNCKSIESIVISEGVTTIKNDSFCKCVSLKSVYIPKSVTTIESKAFREKAAATAGNLNVTIYGYYGSAAETFAKENGLSFANACKHTETEIKNAVEATCTKEGYTGDKVCKECGDVVEPGKEIKVKPHTPGEAARENVVAATCSKKGSYDEVIYCTVCNSEIERNKKEIETIPHTLGEWTITAQATCKADGKKERSCKNCTYIDTETIPASTIPHTYDEGEVTTPATCTKEGVKTFTCSVCGKTETEVIPVDPNAHTPGEAKPENVVDATCSKEGSYDSVVRCTVCGNVLDTKHKIIDKLDHTFGEFEISEPSTCIKYGTLTRTCAVCKATDSKPLEYLDHNNHINTETVNAKKETCKEAGYTGDIYCKDCEKTVQTGTEIAKLAHTEEIIPAVEATCKSKGLTEGKKCSVCGETIVAQKEVPMKEHTPAPAVKENEVAATCKVNGSYDSVVYCTECGDELSREPVTTDKLAHTEEIIPAVEATCKSKGLTEGKKCSVCGETIVAQKEVPMKEHTPAPAVKENEVAATCSNEGSYDSVVYCTECGDELSRERKPIDLDLNNHVNGYITVKEKAATCKEKGYTGDLCCVDCKKVLEEGEETPIDRFNHTGETETKNAEKATCTKNGYTGDTYCLSCGVRLERGETITAFGHKDEDKDGRCDTCGAEYYTHETCPCRCHKTGFDKFLFKLALFFQMLFDKNQICKCGDIHY